jgi:ATP-dependent RNA helicase DeaD
VYSRAGDTMNEEADIAATSAPAPATGPSDYVATVSFDDLGLSEPVRKAVAERGYQHPTPVQARCIPLVRDGKDLIVRSKTGTGKTAAFAIPLIEAIEDGAREPKVLVLCPTRELALQVAQEFQALAKYRDLRVTPIYGGAPMDKQLAALREGTEIIVGTPGRVYDHIRRKTLDLSGAEAAVLDEADEMLNQGFFEEVTRIIDQLPDDRQTLLFSATVTPDIERLIRRYTRDPESVLLSGDDFTVEGIQHLLYPAVDAYPKPRNLLYLIEIEDPENAIIFCNTRDDTTLVTAVLNRNGFDADVLNGDLPQSERERTMAKVKRGEVRFLVATDIAARGIDISDLSHVLNYSLPEDPAVYLHRVGRTGRIGKTGIAISLVSGRELATLTALEKKFAVKFEERTLPSPEEAQRRWADRHVAELKDAAQGSVFEAMVPLAQAVRQREDGDFLTAYLLKYFFTHHRMEILAKQSAPAPEPSRDRPRREERPPRDREPRRGEGRHSRDRERGRPARPSPPNPRDGAAPPRTDLPPSPPAPENSVKLWVNVGSADGFEPSRVASLLAELASVDTAKIKLVDSHPKHSYVYVDSDAADAVAQASREKDGRRIRIERAKR